MNTQSNLQRWERYAEWPLAAAALLFLGLFSVQVLARPQGREAYVLWLISWIVWGLFIVDYVVRLYLASNRWHWFCGTCWTLRSWRCHWCGHPLLLTESNW